MQRVWRHSSLPVGILLVALGVGNSLVSAGKIDQYGDRIEATTSLETNFDRGEIQHLTARTNESLLRRLHRGPGPATVAAAKRDFYTLVYNGGRVIALAGILFVLFGARAVALDAPGRGAERV